MKLKEFQEKFPDDLKSGALAEIQQKFVDRAQAVDKALSQGGPLQKAKRPAVGEPVTVMRTVRARKTRHLPGGGDDGGETFNGVPLQTPMPFRGEAVPLPVTMLMQHKKGSRTKASNVPSAAVVTTKDGKQWALGGGGLSGIPESHREEVMGLLASQFDFLASALGKSVSDTRGSR